MNQTEILILYFSVYGTDRKAAEMIQKETEGDLVEIVPEIPYDSCRDHYHALAQKAWKEKKDHAGPHIRNHIPVNQYETIFLGYPIWWDSFPMIIHILIDTYDFSGKTIIPFCTSMGSGDCNTFHELKEMVPDAYILPGLSMEMQEVESDCTDTVRKWLEKVRMDEKALKKNSMHLSDACSDRMPINSLET